MNFATFNQQNGWVSGNAYSTNDFYRAASEFFKLPKHVGYTQAYQRGNRGQLQILMTNLVGNRITAATPLTRAALLITLGTEVDVLWKQTVKVRGEAQRQLEKRARLLYYDTGMGAGTCPGLDSYARATLTNINSDFTVTALQREDYVAQVCHLASPYLPVTAYNLYNACHKQAEKLNLAAGFMGEYKEDSSQWRDFMECANFWEKEIPLIAARRPQLTFMQEWAAGSDSESVFRLVSQGEKDHTINNRVFSQGPTSFERHKWFYFRKGAPGVTQGWVMTIPLKGKPIDQLMKLTEEVGEESKKTSAYGLLSKANEHDCIGIHEDLLEAFCTKMVTMPSVTAKLKT